MEFRIEFRIRESEYTIQESDFRIQNVEFGIANCEETTEIPRHDLNVNSDLVSRLKYISILKVLLL